MRLNELTIKEALEGLRKKDFSTVELVENCFSRIEKKNKILNAFLALNRNGALENAKKADRLRESANDLPLLGIPIALKDLFLTKNLRTTAGSRVLEDYIPTYNATVVRKLEDAGAIVIGKTNLDAWGHGASGENSDFGPTKNPWNEEHVPGGSSSGSATAVASNMCLAATSTDTGGSTRQPASFTNIVGLKPTYGLVSRYGIVAMASSLDCTSHMTKTVEDSAIFLNVTAGNDPKDATSLKTNPVNYLENLKDGVKGVKIGFPKEYFTMGMETSLKENLEKVVRKYEELGAEIVEISLPHTEYGLACYYIIMPSEVSSNLARYDGIRYGNDRTFFGDEAIRRIILGSFTLSSGYYDAYYKKAMQVRTLIKNDFDQAFENVDTIISPVSTTPPWKLGEKINDPLKMYLSDIYTIIANLAGIPGLAVPSGFINDLPIGFQLLGPQLSEKMLFKVGSAFEQTQERKKLT